MKDGSKRMTIRYLSLLALLFAPLSFAARGDALAHGVLGRDAPFVAANQRVQITLVAEMR